MVRDAWNFEKNLKWYVQSKGFHRNRQSLTRGQGNRAHNCMKTVTVCLQMLTYRRQLTLQHFSKNTQLCVLKCRVNTQNYVQSEGVHWNRQSLTRGQGKNEY
jgi:hypothetical protein